jgi:hypothetical protein
MEEEEQQQVDTVQDPIIDHEGFIPSDEVLSMDEFLARACTHYPEVSLLDFASVIELVVNKTDSQEMYLKHLEEGSNLLNFLYHLSNCLPNS